MSCYSAPLPALFLPAVPPRKPPGRSAPKESDSSEKVLELLSALPTLPTPAIQKQIKPFSAEYPQNQSQASCGPSLDDDSHPGLGQLCPLTCWQLDVIVSPQLKHYPNPFFSSLRFNGRSIKDHDGAPQAANAPQAVHPPQAASPHLTFLWAQQTQSSSSLPRVQPNPPIKSALLPDCLAQWISPANAVCDQ